MDGCIMGICFNGDLIDIDSGALYLLIAAIASLVKSVRF